MGLNQGINAIEPLYSLFFGDCLKKELDTVEVPIYTKD